MLWLLLLQVWASCLWLGHGEVVTSIGNCSQLFYWDTHPNEAVEPENPAWICQSYSNSHYPATLYGRNRHFPIYSAYRYEPGPGKRLEPQLMGPTYPKTMETKQTLRNHYNVSLEKLSERRTVLQDYKNLMGFSQGHLNPSGHPHDCRSSRMAPFTLTNTVPQEEKLNRGSWKNYSSKR